MIPAALFYCESFADGPAVLLAKERHRAEVVHDINGDLVALHRCAQFHPEALIGEFELIPGARMNLADLLAQPGLTDLQRAARFLAANRFSFAGNHHSFAVSRTRPAVSSRANVAAALRPLNARLDRVAVERLTWRRRVSLYDSPGGKVDVVIPECPVQPVQALVDDHPARGGEAVERRGVALIAQADIQRAVTLHGGDHRLAALSGGSGGEQQHGGPQAVICSPQRHMTGGMIEAPAAGGAAVAQPHASVRRQLVDHAPPESGDASNRKREKGSGSVS